MGIPMYCGPSSTEAPKNNTVKGPCAAARSAIRRQATVRRPSHYSVSALRSATLRSPFPRPIVDEIEREANGLPRHSHSPVPIPVPGGDPFDHAHIVADNSQREAAGLQFIRDALDNHGPGQRLRMPRSSLVSDANNRPERQEHHPFTPRFAPAFAYHRSSTPLAGPDLLRLSPMPRHDPPGDAQPGSSFLPSFRRLNRRSIIDGLGDRQRSVDLEDDHANDAWETLLTTIAPDTNLPSTDSSFTSTTTSRTNGSRNGTTGSSATSLDSLQTSLQARVPTIQMTLDPHPEFPNPCDYSSSNESDTESDGEITQQSLFRRYRRRMRQVESMRRSHHLQSTMNNPPPIPTISFDFSESSTDQDLVHMQAILDRLARREDIPDGWWAAAGLSRTIGQRTGGNDDSNVPNGAF
ncbi:hypothetical protein BJX99DRAFT_218528 [Aspergillus californicus]